MCVWSPDSALGGWALGGWDLGFGPKVFACSGFGGCDVRAIRTPRRNITQNRPCAVTDGSIDQASMYGCWKLRKSEFLLT